MSLSLTPEPRNVSGCLNWRDPPQQSTLNETVETSSGSRGYGEVFNKNRVPILASACTLLPPRFIILLQHCNSFPGTSGGRRPRDTHEIAQSQENSWLPTTFAHAPSCAGHQVIELIW